MNETMEIVSERNKKNRSFQRESRKLPLGGKCTSPTTTFNTFGFKFGSLKSVFAKWRQKTLNKN